MNKNISIITNFGCQTDCWYCIWKKHSLHNVQLDTDWDKLYDFLYDNKEKGKVSVSGGGDCLYKWDIYQKWWDQLFLKCEILNIIIDVHSREKFYNDKFWSKINRCVVSSDIFSDDNEYFDYLLKHTKIRIVHVVTKDSTKELINEYIEYEKSDENCQFTIKELVGYDDNENYESFKNIFGNDLFALDDGDYNIYYMPDNTITDKFLF